jgi:hypothetical protein
MITQNPKWCVVYISPASKSRVQLKPLNGLDPTWFIWQNIKEAKTRKPKALKKKAPMQVPEIPKVDSDVDISIKWTRDPQWAAAFIPSLMQALYTSHKPFEDFKHDSPAGFLDIIQEIFDTCFLLKLRMARLGIEPRTLQTYTRCSNH